uniref:Ribosomal protein S6 n=1 Tax=Chromera velia CCMP2878 TaxID=1169474 RepID=A0A0G4I6X9_9ALVE|mmetsp:Transcript_52790/g.103226  ORF Transcript_52790/g.103226 Transcript_52790/m.103226 type:complete len:106 (+) Transcript_52790:271-588(+)|eukprot:Cvel_11446.t1-p1 / transcript=Cvel_11446.t1 / gene=Cvel_11446 / organism=Chromera_velia_CCMP2878 / gene_product=hypothetical protein / transcript_product=hypothetical protein / location=Cvel_scaffold720:17057-17371(-) / protein_length=105 / sequence_SO=supercontig / SO=protein_coding / is_pseudo=false
MVFYETFVVFSQKTATEGFRKVLHEMVKAVGRHQGTVLRVKDLGWRKLSFRVDKPTGCYHFGRFFYMSFGASPGAPHEMSKLLQSQPAVLREVTMKLLPKRHLPL